MGKQSERRILDDAIRHAMAHPVTLAIAIGIMLFTSFLTPGGRLAELGLVARFGINAFNLATYFLFSVLLLGRWLAWGLARGWPWMVLIQPFYLAPAVAVGVLDTLILRAAGEAATLWLNLAAIIATSVLAASFASFALQDRIKLVLVSLGKGDQFVNFAPQNGDGLTEMLPADVAGPVQILRGANQYVEVETDRGNALVRIPLRDAEAMMPKTSGGRVHRSVWVAWDHVVAVEKDKQRLILRTRDDSLVPVSRTYKDNVLETLRLRGLDC